MNERKCVRCDQPARDTGLLCDRCMGQLARSLGDVAALAEDSHDLTTELVVTFARLGRLGDNGGRRSAESPVPYDDRAREAFWVLENTLSTWARDLLEHIDPPHGPSHPDCLHPSCNRLRTWQPSSARPSAVATWLLGRLEQIRHHPAADECHDEITAAVLAVEHVVDRPMTRWYAGPCTGSTEDGPCDAELYAAPKAETFTCRDCGTAYDVAERRSWLLDEAREAFAHAELIATALTSLGQPLTSAMVRSYAHRCQIFPRTVDLLGRPLYRVGDVMDVHQEVLSRRAEQQAKRGRAVA